MPDGGDGDDLGTVLHDGAGGADLLDHEGCEGRGAGNPETRKEVMSCDYFGRGWLRARSSSARAPP